MPEYLDELDVANLAIKVYQACVSVLTHDKNFETSLHLVRGVATIGLTTPTEALENDPYAKEAHKFVMQTLASIRSTPLPIEEM